MLLLGRRGQLFCDTLERVSIDPGFDAITLWDVLEHVPDPLSFLCRCYVLLKPGGYLFLNVPDLVSLQARILGKRWPLLLAEHLNYFNRGSLKRCGANAGLTLVSFGRRSVDFSIEYLLYRLAQHGIPGARIAYTAARKAGWQLSLPVALDETWGVWKR
jgi:SAM-dependent methyltransferase